MACGDRGGGHLRVAIIGLGPKGLFALERLLHHARRIGPRALLDIDLFEPHPVPGAGPVYDPGEPEYLRMNFAADQLDMWWADSRAVPIEERLPFLDWRRSNSGDGVPQERYPPRAHVGRYLAEGFARMRRHVPVGARITLRPVAVRAARRLGLSWTVVAADRSTYYYDELLVAVGHRTCGAQPRGRSWKHAAPLIPAVFPVTRWLSHDLVAPGSTVAVRGFALTFLDAAIALTEGRGGRFETDRHPYRLRYSPSVHDVGLILPFSRSGRPMLAKPEPQLAAAIPALDTIAQSGRAQILALPKAFCLQDDLLATLASTAAASLLAANGCRPGGERSGRAGRAAGHWLQAACHGAPPRTAQGPVRELERSLAVGAGLHPPDLQWALGQSWRSLYPAVVARLSGTGLPDHAWPAFRRLAAQLERVSFGPPPVNAAKLLALVAARRVDLTHVAAAQITTGDQITSIRSKHGTRAVDAVVNAVLPAPGAMESDGGLLPQLIADGHARILSGRRGLEVAPDSNCIGRDGRRSPGLSAVGRPTEDSVIGNDTLSRSLHPQADRWALRIARRSIQPALAPTLSTRPPREAA